MSKAMWIITSNTKDWSLTHKLGKFYYYFFLTAYYCFPKLIADEFMEILLISMKFGKRSLNDKQ